MKNNPICPICEKPSIKITGEDLYRSRPDLYDKKFFRCEDHTDYYVGCHADGKPLGVLANKEHRRLKTLCHEIFDPFWATMPTSRGRHLARLEAYSRLSGDMEISADETHFGMFTEDQCKKAYEIIQSWKN